MSFTTSDRDCGEYKHQLTVKELPPHSHPTAKGDVSYTANGRTKVDYKYTTYQSQSEISTGYYWTARTMDEGEGNRHNNIQPSTIVFFWQRVS